MITEDLSSLFMPNPQGSLTQAFSVCLGQILTFNPATGNNTVGIVGQGKLTDVPMLKTGAEIGLAAGQMVLLGQIGYSYVIIGAVIQPGSSGFAGASVATASANNTALGWGATGGVDNTVVTTTLTAPYWANTVALSGQLFVCATQAVATQNFSAWLVLDGANGSGSAPAALGLNGSFCEVTAGYNTTHSITGGSTLTCTGHFEPGTNVAANAGNGAIITVSAIFTKS